MRAVIKKRPPAAILADRLEVKSGQKWAQEIFIIPRPKRKNKPPATAPDWCQEHERGWAE